MREGKCNATFCPPFVWKFILSLRRFISLELIKILNQNLIFVAANYVYKHCGDVCNDVIPVPVIRGSVATYFRCGGQCCILFCMANWTDFRPVKEFWKSVKTWRNYCQNYDYHSCCEFCITYKLLLQTLDISSWFFQNFAILLYIVRHTTIIKKAKITKGTQNNLNK